MRIYCHGTRKTGFFQKIHLYLQISMNKYLAKTMLEKCKKKTYEMQLIQKAVSMHKENQTYFFGKLLFLRFLQINMNAE